MIVLGIETSCDETAVAVVEDRRTIRSNLISSQIDVHRRFGGVVPELASRAHVEVLNPLLDAALSEAGVGARDLDGVAVTVGPGLIGALLVGVAAAKAISLATGAPLIGVNHLEGHIHANFLEHGDPQPPYVCLLVSGGHTMLVYMPEEHTYEVLGQTLDDAAGEAFDKIARFMGLGFPGGPLIDELARKGDPDAIRFPRAMIDSGDFDFSLSGLKTAVIRYVREQRAEGREPKPEDLAASFQEAVVEVEVEKAVRAAKEKSVGTILLGGGVVANARLRELIEPAAKAEGIEVLYPSLELCTDNAAMIAAAGWSRLVRGERTPLDIRADPGLPLGAVA
jgi:N6-L-threonylcarbamoyladenine synthase